jgi:hypothetical protein
MISPIEFPQLPTCISEFNKYSNLKNNWDYSYKRLNQLSSELSSRFKDDESFSVVCAGSFGRMEASTVSDLDYIVITDDASEAATDHIRNVIESVAKDLDIDLPNATGVFSEIRYINDIVENIGHRDDNLDSLAQRQLLLMESRAIYNEPLFFKTVDAILQKYLDLVISNPEKEAVFLLNDLIRYFRFISVNYQFNFWKDNLKWTIRNVKLRHSRVLIYVGLLFIIMNASKYRKNKYEYIRSKIFLTPIEKIISVYCDNNDHNYYRLLGAYDIFVNRINQKHIREELQVDYDDRYNNPYYAELKVTSDAFQAELTRFIFAQRGNWTEQIFEYLLL